MRGIFCFGVVVSFVGVEEIRKESWLPDREEGLFRRPESGKETLEDGGRLETGVAKGSPSAVGSAM